MASTDKVQFAVSATPIEGVGAAQQGSAVSYIIASETAGDIGGSGTVLALETGWDGSGGAAHGYASGTKYYISSAKATTPTAFGSLAAVEFVIIKHSGYEYSSATALGDANKTDYLTIRALKATDGTLVTEGASIDDGEQPIIAVLYAGEAVVLPLRGGDGSAPMNLSYYGHHSTAINATTAGANTIAIEMFAVA